ncbi:MgtC/SapB family protein [Sulfurospirillum sp. 1612]|uniref:MgtC/SapB family protein n=1 Tax=Sulfurospirillum sp. 1612 TaxID=3094835 RepID=UPI002F92D0ED
MSFDSDLTHFAVTIVLSFLIGLEIKAYHIKFHSNRRDSFIGTARTLTFVGALGFIFYKMDAHHLSVYIAGMVGMTLLYALFYYKALLEGNHSILLYMVMLLVYTFGPLNLMYPLWMSALVFVLIVFVLNAKQSIANFTSEVDAYEFETLGKMVLLSAVILPLLPDKVVIPYIPLSPFKIWLSVVVISAISYGGYLIQKFVFPSKGVFLTGLIGGLYSSTATTVVLAKKTKEAGVNPLMTASIIAATSMMYLRLIVVAFIFNKGIAKEVAGIFLLLACVSLIVAFFYYKAQNRTVNTVLDIKDKNPLELSTAFIFAGLFLIMMLVTHFVIHYYGINGLKLLSFIVGFTDIDPFVLSLLNGKYVITQHEIVAAIIIASGSNNILKSIYALWFGGFKKTGHAFIWLCILGGVTIGYGLLL